MFAYRNRQDLRGGQLVARVDVVVEELDSSQVSTLGILPLDENVVQVSILVLVDKGGVVGVGQLTGDDLVGPGTGPVIPDGDTALILNSEVVVGSQEALLGVVGLSTAGVRQGCPDNGRPVGGAHGLLDKVEDQGSLGVITDHVGHVVDLVDDHTWVLQDRWWFVMPFCRQVAG